MKIVWVILVLIAFLLAGCGRTTTDDSQIVRLEPQEAYASFVAFFAEGIHEKSGVTLTCEEYRDGIAVPRVNGDNRVFEFNFRCDGTVFEKLTPVEHHVIATATVRSDRTWYIREINIE